MEVIGQLHILAILPPGRTPVQIEQEADLLPQPVWKLWREILLPAGFEPRTRCPVALSLPLLGCPDSLQI
jgi:hypothetical protein